MKAHLKYQQNAIQSWMRIDMLLYIYDKTVQYTQTGIQLIESGRTQELPMARLQLQKAIVVITDGLDQDGGELPMNIRRLCLFILDLIRGESATDWKTALELLTELREGFQSIEQEARELECRGVIRGLDPVRG
ncbi:MAG: flagellar protein FliS [Planctomycetaceae bacterium]|nr:flagellar protein FliS [Planctomycetaceae bacterium]